MSVRVAQARASRMRHAVGFAARAIREREMRKTMVLAAVVAALGMVSQPTEARDRGFGVRHFSGHAAPKLHLRHHGFKFHHDGSAGKLRGFKSRHLEHFDHRPLGIPLPGRLCAWPERHPTAVGGEHAGSPSLPVDPRELPGLARAVIERILPSWRRWPETANGCASSCRDSGTVPRPSLYRSSPAAAGVGALRGCHGLSRPIVRPRPRAAAARGKVTGA
jgi:hypothetical protein